jgi:hypothetical protein
MQDVAGDVALRLIGGDHADVAVRLDAVLAEDDLGLRQQSALEVVVGPRPGNNPAPRLGRNRLLCRHVVPPFSTPASDNLTGMARRKDAPSPARSENVASTTRAIFRPVGRFLVTDGLTVALAPHHASAILLRASQQTQGPPSDPEHVE